MFLIVREVWKLNDINICVDVLEDGFILGEMEILVKNPSEVNSLSNSRLENIEESRIW